MVPVPTLLAVKTVLVADDTEFVRERFRMALDGAGHRAITVEDAGQLLAAVDEHEPDIDLLVLDLRLPRGRGTDLVKALRKVEAFAAPVLVFSGTIASASEVRELTRLGVAGYVNEYTSVQHIMPSLAPHLFPDNYNRRSSPRVVVGIPVAYRFGNTIAAAVTLNVSAGGVAVRTTTPLDAGTEVKIRFRVPGYPHEVDADARIAWTDHRVGMGVHFTRMRDEDQAALSDFVESHFFTNRKA